MASTVAKLGEKENVRGEIDTSAPIESVKEAANRFGGFGFWRPNSTQNHDIDDIDIGKVEEQALQLEKELIAKERETLDVLKELENTKSFVEDLKLKLHKKTSEANIDPDSNLENIVANAYLGDEEKENIDNTSFNLSPSSLPGHILLELKQAKFNLTKTTNDLSDIRATVESFNKKIEKERLSLEKTRERLSFSSSKISALEEELNQTRLKLKSAQESEKKGDFDNDADVSRELQRLNTEAEEFTQMSEAAKREVFKAISDIDQTKSRIRTAEKRLFAAKKMKEAARATEAVALAEIKALSSTDVATGGVTLTIEEYNNLTLKAQEAENGSRTKVIDAMAMVDEANISKAEILKRVEEATEEVKSSKMVLEEALNKVEAANNAKLSVEEALRKWRSESGQKRRSVQNSAKFKSTSYPNNDVKPVLRPTMSIGQILSRKLLLTEDFENGIKMGRSVSKPNKSLSQMLSSKVDDGKPIMWKTEIKSERKQMSGKRKKFGFAKFAVLMRKQSKNKKKQSPYSGCGGTYSVGRVSF